MQSGDKVRVSIPEKYKASYGKYDGRIGVLGFDYKPPAKLVTVVFVDTETKDIFKIDWLSKL